MRIWGIHKKYKSFTWWESFMGGYLNIGSRITIFGENAMCWVLQIRTKKYGVICITLPSLSRKKRGWPFYIYFSPNGTPWACTFYIGGDKQEAIRANIRKLNFGHGFNTRMHGKELYALNNKFDSMLITDYELDKYGSDYMK